MTTMREHLGAYLAQRRALGHKLVTAEGILKGFCAWLEENQTPSTFTIADVLEWARTPAGTTSLRWSRKLGALRPFAAFVHAIDPDVPVIPARLMPDPPGGSRRAPFIYSQDDLDRLIASCPALFREMRVAVTMQTVIALMAATGIRTGEALTLTTGSINDRDHVLRVHADKTDSDRLIPLHPTTTAGLLAFIDHPARRRYAKRDDPADPIFLTNRGGAYPTGVIDAHFRRLTTAIGLGTPGEPPPRLYDLRHTFATGHIEPFPFWWTREFICGFLT